MARLIRDLGKKTFDVIHADQLWMAPYALLARSQATDALTLVLDAHNAVFQIPQRMAATSHNPFVRSLLELEARKLARYEAVTCCRFDRVVTVTQEDQSTLSNLIATQSAATSVESQRNRNPRISTIPICIDPVAKAVIPRLPNPHRVTFLGGLHWPPNAEGILWFAREVWPRVIQQAPAAVLTVIGKNPPSILVQAASTSTNYDITGYVPDPAPHLSETAAFIVPLHAGGGMRVKIVDAWSWGQPIVSTRIGSEGLDYQDKENLLIADTAEDFAQSVISLLTAPELANRLGAAGRRTAEERYDWRKVYPAWAQVYGCDEGMSTHDSR
jgi:glycosyltransferase involved in cell wall biosynthesis